MRCLAQYIATPPVEPLEDERNITSRYRRIQTNLRGADGSNDTTYEVQAWGNGRGGIDAEWERFHEAWKESYLQNGYFNSSRTAVIPATTAKDMDTVMAALATASPATASLVAAAGTALAPATGANKARGKTPAATVTADRMDRGKTMAATVMERPQQQWRAAQRPPKRQRPVASLPLHPGEGQGEGRPPPTTYARRTPRRPIHRSAPILLRHKIATSQRSPLRIPLSS